MDLITGEIIALKKRCEQLEDNNQSLNNEINLLNKLLFFEQKCFQHLNELFLFYEKNFNSNNKYYFMNEINSNKIIAKNNEKQLNQLRQELKDWRKANNRLDNETIDHTYSSQTNQTNEALKTSEKTLSANQTKAINKNISLLSVQSKATNSRTIISCNNILIIEPIEDSIKPKEATIGVQMEVIPKPEPESDIETDSSPETEENESKAKTKKSNAPFLLVSEYLSNTKAFNDYINKNKINDNTGEKAVNSDSAVDKSIAIDLNIDSDQDSNPGIVDNIDSIFNNEIIDLTPKRANKMSVSKKGSKSKQMTKNKKKSPVKAKASKTANNKTIKISKTELRSNAIKHYRTHTVEKAFKCSLCTKQFRQQRSLNSHLIAHNAGKVFALKSKIISDLSKKVKAKNENKRNANGGGNLICPIPKCDRKYYDFSHLMRHMKQIHGHKKAEAFKKEYNKLQENFLKTALKSINSENSGKKRSIVEKSDKKLAQTPKSVKKRSQIDENEKQWRCDYNNCERRYFDKHNLKRHQMEIHKKLSKVLFTSLKSKTKTGINSKVKFFNPPKVSNNVNDININNNNSESIQSYVCGYNGCEKTYSTASGLFKHKKTKHSSNKTPITVENSNKKLNNESPKSAKRRSDNKPSLTREWICEIANCGSRFIYKQNLKRHMKKDHNSIPEDQQCIESNSSNPKEKYECTYESCAFFTLSKPSLVHHYKSHFESDEKPFKCLITDCIYSTDSLHKLKNHVLNKHSEQEFLRAMEASGVHYPFW